MTTNIAYFGHKSHPIFLDKLDPETGKWINNKTQAPFDQQRNLYSSKMYFCLSINGIKEQSKAVT